MAVSRKRSKKYKAVKKTVTRGGKRFKTTVYKLKDKYKKKGKRK